MQVLSLSERRLIGRYLRATKEFTRVRFDPRNGAVFGLLDGQDGQKAWTFVGWDTNLLEDALRADAS